MNSQIWKPGQEAVVPDFGNYVNYRGSCAGSRTRSCKNIDVTRLRFESTIAGEHFESEPIHRDQEIDEKILIDGDYHCLLRYQRERGGNGKKEKIDYPASVLGFSEFHGEAIVNQIQGIRSKVSYRVATCFNQWRFYQDFLEENFFKNDIPVSLNKNWTSHMMNATYDSKAHEYYRNLYESLNNLRKKYQL